MPSTSEKERKMMAIAEHHPDQLYKKNRGVLRMSHEQLHEFASKPIKSMADAKPKKKSGWA